MIFVLRDLPEVNPVNLGDLEEANTTTVSHELYHQIAHASRIIEQTKLDEMNLEASEGFRQDFHNLEDQLYSLLCHLKVTLMHHNEDIQHSVVAEVLRLPMYTPNTRAKRIVRDCLILQYLTTVTANTQEYFTYFLDNLWRVLHFRLTE